jgi:hypothetical protein
MRKISLFLAFALLISGVAFATEIPQMVNKDFPIVWTETVYNGSGSDISSGYVVQWDYDTSNPAGTWYDDIGPYVQLADATYDPWTAGVTEWGKTMANGTTGRIIIRGPAFVMKAVGTDLTANEFVMSAADGTVAAYGGSADNETILGVCIKNTHGTLGGLVGIIHVQPAYNEI